MFLTGCDTVHIASNPKLRFQSSSGDAKPCVNMCETRLLFLPCCSWQDMNTCACRSSDNPCICHIILLAMLSTLVHASCVGNGGAIEEPGEQTCRDWGRSWAAISCAASTARAPPRECPVTCMHAPASTAPVSSSICEVSRSAGHHSNLAPSMAPHYGQQRSANGNQVRLAWLAATSAA